MRYLLDTNVIIEAVGGCPPAVAALKEAVQSEWVGYSAITRLELFGYPDLKPEEERALQTVIGELAEVAVTASIVDRAIRLRKIGRIKVPDAIIAATAQEMQAVLVTRNEEDFKMIGAIQLLNPFTTNR